MTKPTLVQSLLNRPSQTYADPNVPRKEYYSTKQEMLRIAAEEAARRPSGEGPRVVDPGYLHVPQREEESDSDIDIFFTPNTSPRASMASTGTARRKLSRRSLNSTDSSRPNPKPTSSTSPAIVAVPSTRTPSTSSTNYGSTQDRLSSVSISSTMLDAHSLYLDETPDRSEGEREVTYNKAESGRWRNQKYAEEEWAKDVRWLVPPPSSSSNPSKSKTSSTTKTTPVTGGRSTTPQTNKKTTSYAGLGVSSGVEIQNSSSTTPPNVRGKEREKPRPIASPTTTSTNRSPAPQPAQQSQPPKPRRPQPHTFSAFASIATPDIPAGGSSSNTTTTASISKPHALSSTANGNNGRQPSSKPPQGSSTTAIVTSTGSKATNTPTSTSTSTTSRTSQGHTHSSSTTSIPPQKNDRPKPPPSDTKKPHPSSYTPNSNSTSTTRAHRSSNPPSSSSPTSFTSPPKSTTTPPARTRNPKPKPISNMNGGMSALMEEDEEGPLTPRMAHREIDYGSSGSSKHDAHSRESTPGGAKSTTTDQSRSLRHTSKPDALRRRRSRSLDSLTNSLHSSSNSASTFRKPPQTLQSEVTALLSTFSHPGELPSKGTQGYTSLVLPRAPAPMGAAVAATSLSPNGKIDLTRTGIAQTTMATVEVVRGLGASRGIFGLFGRKRTLSSSGGTGPLPLPLGGAGVRRASADAGIPSAAENPPAMIKRRTTPMGFTSYRPPPNHVPSGSVLVQVWAVALDGIDGRLVGVRFGAEMGRGAAYHAQRGGRRQQDDAGQETERDDEDTEHEDEEERRENEETDAEELSTAQTNPSTKKGPLAALGRSLSQRLSRATSTNRKEKRMNGNTNGNANANVNHTDSSAKSKPISPPKRSLSFSLKRSNTATSHASSAKSASSSAIQIPNPPAKRAPKTRTRADVGYIPGRSFVGRVLECGWDVRDEIVRKGEWVVGLLDVRKGGALAEFIVVDRRRVHRVPHPWKTAPPVNDPAGPVSPVWIASPTPTQTNLNIPSTLTLEELALLPLCGLPAYRAIRTFTLAFSSARDGTASPGGMSSIGRRGAGFDFASSAASSSYSQSDHHLQSIRSADHDQSYRRRILVLRGHDGTGAMAVQLLVQRGWRVSVHVPFSSVPSHASQEVGDAFMRVIEERVRIWGADEVIFDDGEEGGGGDDGRGAAVRVLDTLREDGDVFDAVLDTVGGKEVREAGERLLRSPGFATEQVPNPQRQGVGQFTTLVGDVPERVIPSAADNFRAGLRAFRLGGPQTQDAAGHGGVPANGTAADEELNASPAKGIGKVGYAWISVAQDVDWDGDDVGETLGIVVRLALENGVRPIVEDVGDANGESRERVVSFERAPVVFVDDGPLKDGGTVVVKVAG